MLPGSGTAEAAPGSLQRNVPSCGYGPLSVTGSPYLDATITGETALGDGPDLVLEDVGSLLNLRQRPHQPLGRRVDHRVPEVIKAGLGIQGLAIGLRAGILRGMEWPSAVQSLGGNGRSRRRLLHR
jgi:hypothetical protein